MDEDIKVAENTNSEMFVSWWYMSRLRLAVLGWVTGQPSIGST